MGGQRITDEELRIVEEGGCPAGWSRIKMYNCRKKLRASGVSVKKSKLKETKLDKLDDDTKRLIGAGIRIDEMDTTWFSNIRKAMREQGYEGYRLGCFRSSWREIFMCAAGCNPGHEIEKRRYIDIRRRLKDIGFEVKTLTANTHQEQTVHRFTPDEDYLIINGENPSGVNKYESMLRRIYLQKNFVDVGWGDLIGKQTITGEFDDV